MSLATKSFGTVGTGAIVAIVAGLDRLGFDPAPVLRAAGIDRRVLEDPDARLDGLAALAVWDHAVRLTGDPDLGLHLAEHHDRGAFGVFEYVVSCSPTVRESWERLEAYFRLVHDGPVLSVEIDGDRATLHRRVAHSSASARAIAEFFIAKVHLGGRRSIGSAWTPLEVRFTHARPETSHEHRRVFATTVYFGAESDALVIPRSLLELPSSEANAGLGAVLTRYAQELVDRLPQADDITARTHRAIAHSLGHGHREARIEPIARTLGMSARTLSRHLSAAGTSYQQLLDAVRCDLAKAYLHRRELAIAEVAFLIGFSEASAFHRAFRKWTGTTAASYRAQVLATAARALPWPAEPDP